MSTATKYLNYGVAYWRKNCCKIFLNVYVISNSVYSKIFFENTYHNLLKVTVVHIYIEFGNNIILPLSTIVIENLLLKSANTRNKGQWYANIFKQTKILRLNICWWNSFPQPKYIENFLSKLLPHFHCMWGNFFLY